MYVPKKFELTDSESIREFIVQNGFGIVVTNNLVATHTPLMINEEGTILTGHISKANPQWKSFQDNEEVLAIFQGPHGYISSSWYNHENVPTWNYIAAHVYGTVKILKDEALVQSLSSLVDKYEKYSEHPVSVQKMTPQYFEQQLRGVVGFEIAIKRIEAAKKLSQNRDAVNYQSIISNLEKRGMHDDGELAKAMRENVSAVVTPDSQNPDLKK